MSPSLDPKMKLVIRCRVPREQVREMSSQWILKLGLKPHPEGGYFPGIFRYHFRECRVPSRQVREGVWGGRLEINGYTLYVK